MHKVVFHKIVLSLLFITLAIVSSAQDSAYAGIGTPYNPKGDYQTLGIKGKLLPWLLGNAGGLNGLLGFEVGFFKNNSIGIDGYFYAQEADEDRFTPQNQSLPSRHYDGIDRAVFINYRHYFSLQKLRENLGLTLYTGILTRYGKNDDNWDYGFSTDSIIYTGKTYYSAGLFTGFIYKFRKLENLYLDINFQFLYNDKYIFDVYSNQLQLTSTNGQFITYDMRVGINLYWCFNY